MMPAQNASSNAAQCSGSLGEEHFVLQRFFSRGKRRRPGVFLEVRLDACLLRRPAAHSLRFESRVEQLGAFDGWQESNTLHLESCLGWRGVLMDAATHADWMAMNRPGALSVGLAVCPQMGYTNYSSQRATTAGIVSFMSRSVRRRFKVDGAGEERVPCAPLSALLGALRLRHIDFLSLDVQGAELMVLKSIDWTVTTIGVLIAECKGLGCGDVQDAAVRTLLESTAGLQWHGVLRARHDVWDAVYTNRSLATEAVASRWHEVI